MTGEWLAGRRPVAFRKGAAICLEEFRRHVAAIAAGLPAGAFMINLCEDRYCFLVSYAAAAGAGHTVLLPSSRVERVVAEVEAAHPGSYRLDDAMVENALRSLPASRADDAISDICPLPRIAGEGQGGGSFAAEVPAGHTVMIAFTSGSTGEPKRFPKSWRSVNGGTAHNAAAIRGALGCDEAATPWILATVPPQHMYGMEMSVLLPLIGGMAVHSARPLFPADVARALENLPAPRVLVSTPVHLRAIVESPQEFPAVDLVVSATAPLDQPLAAAVERKLGGRLLEVFGSTETCVFASRQTAVEPSWRLYEGVTLQPTSDATWVNAPWFSEPVMLQDIVELQANDRFVVRGRNADMIEVAGKRASLGDLTRRILAIEGVQDAVVFQPDADAVAAIRRVAALVVAPGLTAAAILERLAPSVDPAFLPRPLIIVDALPRNEVGKLPRESLLALVRR